MSNLNPIFAALLRPYSPDRDEQQEARRNEKHRREVKRNQAMHPLDPDRDDELCGEDDENA